MIGSALTVYVPHEDNEKAYVIQHIMSTEVHSLFLVLYSVFDRKKKRIIEDLFIEMI